MGLDIKNQPRKRKGYFEGLGIDNSLYKDGSFRSSWNPYNGTPLYNVFPDWFYAIHQNMEKLTPSAEPKLCKTQSAWGKQRIRKPLFAKS